MIIFGKIVGSVGVILSLVGFLFLSGGMIYAEGLSGTEAREIYGEAGICERWFAWFQVHIFKIIGIFERPRVDMSTEETSRINRKRELIIVRGAYLIMVGSIMQAVAYWIPPCMK